jgi:hypothetical protein
VWFCSKPPPAEDDGVDHDQEQPGVDGGTHAEERDADRQQKDYRYREASEQEETYRLRVQLGVYQTMATRRVPVNERQQQPAYRQCCGVDRDRKLMVTVLAQQRGGEGHERDEHEEDGVEPDEAPVVTPDIAEDAEVDIPERDDDQEAEHLAEVLRPQGEQLGWQLLRNQVVGHLWYLYVQH